MISSTNLSLRALEKADLKFFHKLDNSFRNMRYFFEEPYETFRELEDLFEKSVHNHRERWFIIELRESRESVGVLTLYDIDEINRKAGIDILIDESKQGKGYGKEAFILGVKYAFDILNLFKIYLLVTGLNEAAQKIYSFAGFRKECTLEKEYYVNGEYVDVDRMCMFSDGWKEKRPLLKKEFAFD